MTDVAIVTGGAGGIGQAINRRLARRRVHRGGRRPRGHAREGRSRRGEGIHPVEMDVRDQASVDAAVAKAVSLGRLRGVVNCAGPGALHAGRSRPDEDEMDVLWHVNVAGMARVLKACHAAPRRGLGDRQHREPDRASSAGSPAPRCTARRRPGVMAYTRYLACELAPDVRVNCLAPGYIAVPMSPSMRAVSGGEEPLIPTGAAAAPRHRRRDG